MKRIALPAVLCLLGLSTMLPLQAYTWHTDVVAHGLTGSGASLSHDPSGQACISYVNEPRGFLGFARYTGAGWTNETVDSTDYHVMGNTALAFDSDGRAHIAYMNRSTQMEVRYASATATGWELQTLFTGDVSTLGSLAFDAAGSPYIACLDSGSDDLMYAYMSGGTWLTRVVADCPSTPDTTLAIDSTGAIHIAYLEAGVAPQGKYAIWDGTDWSREDLWPTGCPEFSLALDSDGRPHIAYTTLSGSLMYAYKSSSGWVQQAIASPGRYMHTSIVLDPSGTPYIAYASCYGATMFCAYQNGSSWVTDTIEQGRPWLGVSLSSMWYDGRLYVAYVDSAANDLKCAIATVPEPSCAIALAFGLGAFIPRLVSRRRR